MGVGCHTAAEFSLALSEWGALGRVPSRAGWFSITKACHLHPALRPQAGVTGYLPAGPEPWEPPSRLAPPSLPLHHCLQLWSNGELGEEEGEARSGGKQLEQLGFCVSNFAF